jgi:hypothetical protein
MTYKAFFCWTFASRASRSGSTTCVRIVLHVDLEVCSIINRLDRRFQPDTYLVVIRRLTVIDLYLMRSHHLLARLEQALIRRSEQCFRIKMHILSDDTASRGRFRQHIL